MAVAALGLTLSACSHAWPPYRYKLTINVDDNGVLCSGSSVAYDWDGKSVISYRGTDNPSIFANPQAGASDIWSGWVTGAGLVAGQADDAAAFYQAVSGRSLYAWLDSNIILTGHSLGGGLAGFVGALTHDSTTIFDYMPYAAAATAAAIGHDVPIGVTDPLALPGGAGGAVLPSGSSITAEYVTGEVLHRH